MGRRLLLVLLVSGCDRVSEPPGPLECSADWALRPCEVEACEACSEMGGVSFLILESYPAQYACGDQDGNRIEGFWGSDYCEHPYCEPTITVLDSPEEPTRAGITGQDLLDQVEGERTSTLTWFPNAHRGVHPPHTGETDLSWGLTRNGELRYVTREEIIPETDGVPDVGPGVVHCFTTVEADMVLRLETSDGGLDETWPITIFWAVDEPDHPRPFAYKELQLPELVGTLRETTPEEGYELSPSVYFDLMLDAQSADGNLQGGTTHHSDSGWVGFGYLDYAAWSD